MCPKPTLGRAGFRQRSDCAATISAFLSFAVIVHSTVPAVSASPDGTTVGITEDAQTTRSPAAATQPPAAAATPPGPTSVPPVEIEEVDVIAKRLEAARAAIEPQIGASTYTVTRQAIEAMPGGANNTLNQVVLQAPGVSQ